MAAAATATAATTKNADVLHILASDGGQLMSVALINELCCKWHCNNGHPIYSLDLHTGTLYYGRIAVKPEVARWNRGPQSDDEMCETREGVVQQNVFAESEWGLAVQDTVFILVRTPNDAAFRYPYALPYETPGGAPDTTFCLWPHGTRLTVHRRTRLPGKGTIRWELLPKPIDDDASCPHAAYTCVYAHGRLQQRKAWTRHGSVWRVIKQMVQNDDT